MSVRFFDAYDLAPVLALGWLQTHFAFAAEDLYKVHVANADAYKRRYPACAPFDVATQAQLEHVARGVTPSQLTHARIAEACTTVRMLRYNCDDAGPEACEALTRIEATFFFVLDTLHDPDFGTRHFEQRLREARIEEQERSRERQRRLRERAHQEYLAKLPPVVVRLTGVTRHDFSCGYPEPGDKCSPGLVDEQRDVLPPAAMGSGYLQVGEPSRHTDDGHALFATFQRHAGAWVYMGALVLWQKGEVE